MKEHILPVALQLGLPHIGWHSFRHSVTAWGKETGLTLEELRQLIRHEDPDTTSKYYGRLELGAKRELQRRVLEHVMLQAKTQGWKEPLALPEAG